jgi:hypothetical protein
VVHTFTAEQLEPEMQPVTVVRQVVGDESLITVCAWTVAMVSNGWQQLKKLRVDMLWFITRDGASRVMTGFPCHRFLQSQHRCLAGFLSFYFNPVTNSL